MDGTVCRACIPVPGLPLLYRNILYDLSGCGCKKGIAADGIFYGISFASYCKSASVPPLFFSCFQYNRRDGRIWGQNVVHRFGCQMLTHLPLNVKTGGRDGLPCGEPLPRWDQRDTKNPRNEIVEDSVSGTVISNLRPQRRRGVPKARLSRPAVLVYFQEPAQRVPSIGVRRKRGCEKIHTPGHWSLVTGSPPSKALHSALFPLH